jgi:thioredoxin
MKDLHMKKTGIFLMMASLASISVHSITNAIFKGGQVIELSDVAHKYGSGQKAFNAILKEHKKIVVDFYGPSCGPCRTFAPIFECTAKEYSDILFVKVNVQEQRTVATQHGVGPIPAIHFFKNGKTVGSVEGARKKPAFKGLINNYLK